ncbi:NADH-dependent FMN reductase [Virgibacillus dokdonensis]|uniref:FMN reductase/FAD reductase [NAD(P)H] n=2 Tax=Virgibacillus TaxID=84406 RepID=A0A1M5S011_9BACI|nr:MULTISPECIES: NAD(P)H-dependent oxidoreductase [Virgibacillus]RFA33484.1 NADH-dependent FMN reductase [Virgibacillus dokdonensis]SHH31937.1 FMN reductase/FAD reductase [NAD(P)H] [Virgibacillus chiguensis]
MKLVGIAGSLVGEKTSQVVHDVLRVAKRVDKQIEIELIDLKEYDVEFVKGSPLAYYNKDTWYVVNTILAADMIVFGSPIYQASISGALKNLLDHFPIDAFKSKVTGIVTTAGSDKHFLVSEYQLKPILAYLKGIIPRYSVFVNNDCFNDDNEIIDQDVQERINKLAQEMITIKKRTYSI